MTAMCETWYPAICRKNVERPRRLQTETGALLIFRRPVLFFGVDPKQSQPWRWFS
jgi:hypothetical protein